MKTSSLRPDPLRRVYRQSIAQNPGHHEYLARHRTALLCIDLQYLDAKAGHGLFRDDADSPVSREGRDYYFGQLETRVIPNVQRLQAGFRDHDLEVIHVRIQALTRDGRDRSKGHKRLELLAAPGSEDARFLEEVEPRDDEIIINKTASGVFSSTNLHYVLKNLSIEALFVVGVYTNECVETTVRDACDLGYLVSLVEDGCTTVTPELHQASLQTLRNRYCRIITTDEALADIATFTADAGAGDVLMEP